jgi:protein SCO1/2
LIFMTAVAAIGAGTALLWRSRPGQAAALATGTLLDPRRDLPDFSLTDEHGTRFTRADLTGHWSMLYFGYTNCPDLCPATLSTLAAMEKRLRDAGDRSRPRVIFVSVDARRDTPAQLAKYVPYFDPEFLGVTAATQPAIEAVARGFGVAVDIHPEAGGGYSVDHSGALLVIDPAGRLAAILTGPFTAASLEVDFRRIAGGGA